VTWELTVLDNDLAVTLHTLIIHVRAYAPLPRSFHN
jgi:hypothetical protein